MKFLEDAPILDSRLIRPGIHSLLLRSPEIARHARPGQFVHVRVRKEFHPLLRRPLSVGRVEGDRLELVWRIVGEGTALLAQARMGDTLDLLGPLGRPFTIPAGLKRALLVAGGLGLPPLVFLHEELLRQGVSSRLLLGVRGEEDIPLAENDPLLETIEVTAEEGGAYRRGLVTEPAAERLAAWAGEGDGGLAGGGVYVCGPWGLVAAMQKVVPRGGLDIVEVSLEQQMGCGIGVCQGCAVRVAGGPTPYRLTCSEGPVFPLFAVEVPDGR